MAAVTRSGGTPSGECLRGKRQVWCICRVKPVWSIPDRFWGEVLTKRRYTNVRSFFFTFDCVVYRESINSSELLSSTEIAMLICGVVFFIAFFTATFSEIRVDRPLHRLLCDVVSQNIDWHIEPYSRELDCGVSRGNSGSAHDKQDSPAWFVYKCAAVQVGCAVYCQ